jgi:hypothetical protein
MPNFGVCAQIDAVLEQVSPTGESINPVLYQVEKAIPEPKWIQQCQ